MYNLLLANSNADFFSSALLGSIIGILLVFFITVKLTSNKRMIKTIAYLCLFELLLVLMGVLWGIIMYALFIFVNFLMKKIDSGYFDDKPKKFKKRKSNEASTQTNEIPIATPEEDSTDTIEQATIIDSTVTEIENREQFSTTNENSQEFTDKKDVESESQAGKSTAVIFVAVLIVLLGIPLLLWIMIIASIL